MSTLKVTVRHRKLATFHMDYEAVEFHGDFDVSSLYVGSRGDLEINLLRPEADTIFIGRDNWTVWIVDEMAKLHEEWEQLYPRVEEEARNG